MSYKSREKKRQYKKRDRAIREAQEKHRKETAERHFLTLVSRPACCNSPGCGRALRQGQECVYRHTPREILCVECATLRRIYARPSRKWEKHNRKRTTNGKLVPAASRHS